MTATPARRYPLQALKYLGLRLPDWLVLRVIDTPALGTQLHQLNFLYNARFVYLGRFKRVGPLLERFRLRRKGEWVPSRESRRFRWTLFVGTFDEPWRPYMQTFLDATGKGVKLAWGDAAGYPGFPQDGTRYAMLDWADGHIVRNQHFYSAFGQAAAFDLRAATQFRREVRASEAATVDAPELQIEFDAVNTAPDAHLITPVPPPERAASQEFAEFATGSNGFVAAIPIPPASEAAVRSLVGSLPSDTFANVAGTQFARLAVVGPGTSPGSEFHRAKLRNSYLLLSADFDGDFSLVRPQGFFSRAKVPFGPAQFDQWAQALAAELDRNSSLAGVFAQCYGFDAERSYGGFSHWLYQWVCPRLVYYNALPDETLESITAGLHAARTEFDRLIGAEPIVIDEAPRDNAVL